MIDHFHPIQTPPTLEPDTSGVPAAKETEKKPRNQHLKSENPKKYQFTARATEQTACTINKAIAARKKQLGLAENGNYDIVMLALDLIKKNNHDLLSSLKTR
ncbi:hypothetical protein I5M32_11305 [Pedobacter sp. SD-b]|uniref:Uncharacterized protein n=1 Tax=Pedobacter segetis TaxID=2793069 RepID=A0ABS1BMW9_9SPHI|nr:hypothetical protein [Pedobacter segetis]MBK0383544.1 hypothetical protein [Pedobacter segetis]